MCGRPQAASRQTTPSPRATAPQPAAAPGRPSHLGCRLSCAPPHRCLALACHWWAWLIWSSTAGSWSYRHCTRLLRSKSSSSSSLEGRVGDVQQLALWQHASPCLLHCEVSSEGPACNLQVCAICTGLGNEPESGRSCRDGTAWGPFHGRTQGCTRSQSHEGVDVAAGVILLPYGKWAACCLTATLSQPVCCVAAIQQYGRPGRSYCLYLSV